jgi:hypothetical protein
MNLGCPPSPCSWHSRLSRPFHARETLSRWLGLKGERDGFVDRESPAVLAGVLEICVI